MLTYLNENPKQWIILDEVSSTNTFLLEGSFPPGTVCLAHHQTAGRGRRKRKWLSSKGHSFLFSGLLCSTNHDTEQLRYLPLLTGAAVLAALQSYIETHAKVLPPQIKKLQFCFKWPNDICLRYSSSTGSQKLGKLCGILVESKIQTEKKDILSSSSLSNRIVLGVGLNWTEDKTAQNSLAESANKSNQTTPIALFSTKLKTTIDKKPSLITPLSFTSYLLKALNKRLQQWQAKEYSFVQEIQQYFCLQNYLLRYQNHVYKAQGLAKDGGLILEEIANGSNKVLYSSEEEFELL